MCHRFGQGIDFLSRVVQVFLNHVGGGVFCERPPLGTRLLRCVYFVLSQVKQTEQRSIARFRSSVSYNTMQYLENDDYSWTVTVHTIPKPTISAAAVPDTRDAESVHYLYVCKKGGTAEEGA